jgi:hypothetical protein
MLLTILGTPSPLTAAVLKCVQALAQAALGPYHWIAAGTASDLRDALAERGQRPVLLYGDIPAMEIVTLLKSANAPIVVVLEPPAKIVRAVAKTRKISGLPALRFASQSLATLHEPALAETALRIGPDVIDVPIPEVVSYLAHHYRIPLDDAGMKAVVGRLFPGSSRPLPMMGDLVPDPGQTPAIPHDGIDYAELARIVLGGYDALVMGQPVTRFEWGAGIFLGAKPHGEPIQGPVELIGGKRCFLFGPYFHIPKGQWSATVDFSVWDNISGNILKVDVYTDRIIRELSSRMPREGRFSCSIDFTVEEPRMPLQIRLFNDEGAIEGRFDLHGITVDRGFRPETARVADVRGATQPETGSPLS